MILIFMNKKIETIRNLFKVTELDVRAGIPLQACLTPKPIFFPQGISHYFQYSAGGDVGLCGGGGVGDSDAGHRRGR